MSAQPEVPGNGTTGNGDIGDNGENFYGGVGRMGANQS